MLPLVSILLPCYNAENYLDYSLDSILNQDYQNLEVICINDGSKDNTLALLKSKQQQDKRIIIVNNETNLGLIDSLNKSFSFIKGDFFARMDADDFSKPDRISLQVNFLLENSEYNLVSSAYNYFRKDGVKLEFVPSIGTLPNSLKFISLFSTPFAHGSILGKTSLIKNGLYYYDKNFSHAEDFELFSRLCWKDIPMTNLRESLYWARLNSGSVSAVYNDAQIKTNHRITNRNLKKYLGIKDTIPEITIKIISNKIDSKVTIKDIKEAFALLHKFYRIADEKLKFTPQENAEIKHYVNLQTLNIIIQSNKIRFRLSKSGNLLFSLRSVFLLKSEHLYLLPKKLARLISI